MKNLLLRTKHQWTPNTPLEGFMLFTITVGILLCFSVSFAWGVGYVFFTGFVMMLVEAHKLDIEKKHKAMDEELRNMLSRGF